MGVTLGQLYDTGEKPTVILYTSINRHAGTPKNNVLIVHTTIKNKHSCRGEVLRYTVHSYTNRHAGTPNKTRTNDKMGLDYKSICNIASRIGWVFMKGIYYRHGYQSFVRSAQQRTLIFPCPCPRLMFLVWRDGFGRPVPRQSLHSPNSALT